MHTVTDQKSLFELARYFLTLGAIAFGGPPAHIAMMRVDLVDRRAWLSATAFADDLAMANLLPGPTSTELAIYIGYRLRGLAGALIVGICFILPAFVMVLVLSLLYVRFGSLLVLDKILYGIKPVALALVMHGAVQLARPAMLSWREGLVLLLSIGAVLGVRVDIVLIFVAAGLVLLGLYRMPRAGPGLSGLVGMSMFAVGAAEVSTWAVFWTFLKIGALIYGGGFALIGILQQELVLGTGWLTQQQLLDGIAIGQATPGPVFTTATFVGYVVAGLPGALVATVGIFAPAFVFVVLEQRLLGWLKQSLAAKVFLRGVNMAVVGGIIVAAGQMGRVALVDGLSVLIAMSALVGLFRFRIAAHWLVGVGVLVGVLRAYT